MSMKSPTLRSWARGLFAGVSICVLFAAPRVSAQVAGAGTLDSVVVVPNPYNVSTRTYGKSGDPKTFDQIKFYGLPAPCTIRIYSSAGNFVHELKNDVGDIDPRSASWNSRNADNQYVVSDVYIYVVTSPTLGSKIGKLVVIR